MTRTRCLDLAVRAALLVAASMILVIVLASPTDASSIQPWSGASVNAMGETSQGATASATNSFRKEISYYGAGPRFIPYSVYDTGQATATAGTSPQELLMVQGAYQVPGTGSRGGPLNYYERDLNVSASWSNDAVIITPPSGAYLPDQVLVKFSVNFPQIYLNSDPQSEQSGSATLRINDQLVQLRKAGWQEYGAHGSTWDSNGYYGQFDSYTTIRDQNRPYQIPRTEATLHLALPVDKATGMSDPFSLVLNVKPWDYVPTIAGTTDSSIMASLKLTDVTLPDGTSLTSIGYGVAFESGLSWPAPTPEPASFAVWGVALAGFAAWGVRRHAGRR